MESSVKIGRSKSRKLIKVSVRLVVSGLIVMLVFGLFFAGKLAVAYTRAQPFLLDPSENESSFGNTHHDPASMSGAEARALTVLCRYDSPYQWSAAEALAAGMRAGNKDADQGIGKCLSSSEAPFPMLCTESKYYGGYGQLEGLITTYTDHFDTVPAEHRLLLENCLDAMMRLTGNDLGNDPQAWSDWYAENRNQPRSELLIQAFRNAGFGIKNLGPSDKSVLVEIVRKGRWHHRTTALEILTEIDPAFALDTFLRHVMFGERESATVYRHFIHILPKRPSSTWLPVLKDWMTKVPENQVHHMAFISAELLGDQVREHRLFEMEKDGEEARKEWLDILDDM